MGSESEVRWARAVRVLGLLSAVLIIIAVLEAWTVRRARAELQQLRTEREQTKIHLASSEASQAIDELSRVLQWLDAFYAEPTQGFGRPGGLCSGGKLDGRSIAASLAGSYLPARAAGQSFDHAIAELKNAIRRTDAYRAVHPDLALPPVAK